MSLFFGLFCNFFPNRLFSAAAREDMKSRLYTLRKGCNNNWLSLEPTMPSCQLSTNTGNKYEPVSTKACNLEYFTLSGNFSTVLPTRAYVYTS